MALRFMKPLITVRLPARAGPRRPAVAAAAHSIYMSFDTN